MSDIVGVVFEGGGILGIAHAGAVSVLHAIGARPTWYAGSSAGAMIAGLCACGATGEFLREAVSFDASILNDNDVGFIRDAKRLWTKFGYNKGDALEKKYGEYLHKLTGNADITFAEIRERFSTRLLITATKIFKHKCETLFFTDETHPDMPLRRAVRMSASFPIIFAAKDGCLDGGILCNFPIHELQSMIEGRVVGFLLDSEPYIGDEPASNLADALHSIISAMHAKTTNIDNTETIKIPVFHFKSMNFKITAADKKMLFESGQSATREHFAGF